MIQCVTKRGEIVKTDTVKKIDSILAYIKGELLVNFNEDDAILFVEWSKKKLSDTIKDRKEKVILSRMKNCNETDDKKKLEYARKKYLPTNYPINIRIGDIVHVNYGFGFCSEISNGHYAIVLSQFRVNTYFIVPLGSEPLKSHPFYFDDLNLPSKAGRFPNKKSYLQFNQMGSVHYRRMENIHGCTRQNIGETKLKILFLEISKFLGIDEHQK
jgi:mRNA-degrading endonuclease toxin of MazEF toxin-antitoxin module